jgi:hypothetical protein
MILQAAEHKLEEGKQRQGEGDVKSLFYAKTKTSGDTDRRTDMDIKTDSKALSYIPFYFSK